jgi:hypothetical protein
MIAESPEVLERPLTIEEKAKLFPLSFWMRLGAKMKPQCFGTTFDGVGTCAIGAVRDAIGLPLRDGYIRDFFPQLNKMVDEQQLVYHITLKNDAGMTREQIADWLESIGY